MITIPENKLHTYEGIASLIMQELEQKLAYMDSPFYKAQVEQSRREWAARPWHERARIRIKNWIAEKRMRLGEIIAGQEFE